jgi:hypothetical protein
MVASHDIPDRLRATKDARLRGLLEDGLSGGQRIIAKVAFEGAHRFAPWEIGTSIFPVTHGDTLLIGA